MPARTTKKSKATKSKSKSKSKKRTKAPKRPPAAPRRPKTKAPGGPDVDAVVATLRRMGSKTVRDGMARYAIPTDKAFGVAVGDLQKLAKQLGKSHELALALWETGWYEARLLAAFVDEPQRVTAAQMDAWARGFDNWAVCDTACFHLFDRTPHAFRKVELWSRRRDEFVKRAAFALLASVAAHDRDTGDAPFAKCLPLIERAAADDRNFVKKGVSWALRVVGRRSPALHGQALAVAERLSESTDSAPRWIGRDAFRELSSPEVKAAVADRAK